MRLLQEQQNEPNHMQQRINQIIELNELRDKSYGKVQIHQEKMKNTFDKKVKEEKFLIDDLVLKWMRLMKRRGNMESLIICVWILISSQHIEEIMLSFCSIRMDLFWKEV